MTTLISKFRDAVTSGQPPPAPPPPPPSPPPIADNPILNKFALREESGSAGPELVWRVFNATRTEDAVDCSVFVFDKRLPDKWFKPKRKEHYLEMLRDSVRTLERVRHPRMLQVLHTIEEDEFSMAFATEPVYGSLANVLAWHAWLETEEGQVVATQPLPICHVPSATKGKVTRAALAGSRGRSDSRESVSRAHQLANQGPSGSRDNVPKPHLLASQGPSSSRDNVSRAQLLASPGPSCSRDLGPRTPLLANRRASTARESVSRAYMSTSQGPSGSQEGAEAEPAQPKKPYYATEYRFIDFELSYGMLQIVEALQYLHYNGHQVHRNVSPNAIIVCKRGTWKLFGLEFLACFVSEEPNEFIRVSPWTSKLPRTAQPSLNFIAPEMQLTGRCNMYSDVFSLGLVMAAVYNKGTYLINSGNSSGQYVKQMEALEVNLTALEERMPELVREVLRSMLSRDTQSRPNVKTLTNIDYFKKFSVPITALQFLDAMAFKDIDSKAVFYTNTLIDSLPHIPKKLRWQHVWPALLTEVRLGEVLVPVLQPVLWLTNEANHEEFVKFVLPLAKRVLIAWPNTANATVIMLQNLEIIMQKSPNEDIQCDLLPLLYMNCESSIYPIQLASLAALSNVSDYINDDSLASIVLPEIQRVYSNQSSDVIVVNLILSFFENVLVRLDRTQILESILPTLLLMRTFDPTAITRVVKLYKAMLTESKLGLNTEIMAKQLIPQLAPQTIIPGLNMDQFNYVIEMVYEMLDSIERSQRHKIKLEALAQSSPERKRRLLQHLNSDVPAPPFSIPNLRVEKRKTSSAEDMARKNSVGTPSPAHATSSGGFRSSANIITQWIFGSNNSTNNASDKNHLRVGSVLPNRRLSDNTLMTPKIRVAPSCASSPGGSPGGSAGLPIRRHSSIGPQERRGSTAKLSPPNANRSRGRGGSGSSLSVPSTSQNVGGSMPNTSSSVPHLLASRRASRVNSQQGLLQQLGTGMTSTPPPPPPPPPAPPAAD